MTREHFGVLADGRVVDAITLTSTGGVAARIIAYGATLQSVLAPDSNGALADVVLGYADLDSYVTKPEFLGSTIGRVANRIARARFTLDGRTYSTATNDGANTLHGGHVGFDKVSWEVVEVTSSSVTMRYVSPDGEEGFPGTLTAYATYALRDPGDLEIEYRATTDRLTVINMTNHALWNLAGAGSAMDHWMMIPAERYTPVDATLIPTGELRAVAGTAFDFRVAKPIERDLRDASDTQIVFGRGFDHHFVLGAASGVRLIARVEERRSGRVLEVLSDQPGVQFYSGNFLNGTRAGKGGQLYRQGDGFALEPQNFPDIVNQPALGLARLAPGETYRNRIVYRLTARRFL